MEYRKKQGEEWIVLTRQGGGQIEVAAKDEAVMNEDGVYLFHNDKDRTTTFVPMFAIAWVRSYWPGGAKGRTSDVRMEIEGRGASRPAFPPFPTKELESGEVTDAEVVDG